jgi:hypothetical protein
VTSPKEEINMRWAPLMGLLTCFLAATPVLAQVTVVDRPPVHKANSFYPGSRPPLQPTPFCQLPIGSFRSQGWLHKQLELMKDGFTGQLPRISRFLQKNRNSWLNPEGDQSIGWEEVPYWLRGYGDLAYLLRDDRMIAETKVWIEATIKSQADDGYFGPKRNRSSPDLPGKGRGKPDLWANMVMTDCLISWYDQSGDKRVPAMLLKYYKWVASIPEDVFLVPYWQQQRGADMLYQILWLYDRTGEKFLLDLARRAHRHTANWTRGVPDHHNVNMAEAFRGPAQFWLLSKAPADLKATYRGYDQFMGEWGQMPGGGFTGDEVVRKGFTDPRNMFETCGMVEMMRSHEMLTQITGDTLWADRCEDVAFNSLPAALSADCKALRYLTAPNMVLSDRKDRRPEIFNGGPMTLMNPYDHRCCQHNAGFGWPYFVKNMWYATGDDGLAAVLYGPVAITAKVAGGQDVTIEQRTHYPFDQKIVFTMKMKQPARFPFYLRVPGWCRQAEVSDGDWRTVRKSRGKYLRLEQNWKDGDQIELTLDMPVRVETWKGQHNNVSVYRGPLAFSIKIEERINKLDAKEKNRYLAGSLPVEGFDVWEILPGSPWNYGLVLDRDAPGKSFTEVRRAWPKSEQPFQQEGCPLELRVQAKKVRGWRLDARGMPGKLQVSPAKSNEPVEMITLIPMGAARLRIAVMPVIGTGPDAQEWKAAGP